MPSCECENPAGVISVLMRDEDSGQVFGRPLQARQPAGGFTLPEAAVDHQARCILLDQQRVAGAAAAERREADHCNCW
jgi:hypothetical protein